MRHGETYSECDEAEAGSVCASDLPTHTLTYTLTRTRTGCVQGVYDVDDVRILFISKSSNNDINELIKE